MSDTWMSYTAQLSIPMPPPSQFLRFSQGIVFQASFQIKVKSISHESSIVGSYPERPIYGQIRGKGSKFQSASKSTVMHNAADFN